MARAQHKERSHAEGEHSRVREEVENTSFEVPSCKNEAAIAEIYIFVSTSNLAQA